MDEQYTFKKIVTQVVSEMQHKEIDGEDYVLNGKTNKWVKSESMSRKLYPLFRQLADYFDNNDFVQLTQKGRAEHMNYYEAVFVFIILKQIVNNNGVAAELLYSKRKKKLKPEEISNFLSHITADMLELGINPTTHTHGSGDRSFDKTFKISENFVKTCCQNSFDRLLNIVSSVPYDDRIFIIGDVNVYIDKKIREIMLDKNVK